MKKTIFVLLGLSLLCHPLTTTAQEKYAIIITHIHGGPNHQLLKLSWNDTFLIWEMLRNRGFSNENIFVFFEEGEDYSSTTEYAQRYKPDNTIIVDYSASRRNVRSVLNCLYDGSHDFPLINENDFLFVAIATDGHYDSLGSSSISLIDTIMNDIEFANLLNRIPAYKKVFWLQNNNAEYFADNLLQENSIFMFQNRVEKIVVADDSICIENEIINDSIYYHSEFDYHLLSALTSFSPDSLNYYCTPLELFSDADLNQDSLISIHEGFDWADSHNSTNIPFFMIDSSSIDTFTSIEYPTLLHRNLYADETHRGLIGISETIHVPSGKELIFKENSKVYLLNDAELIVDFNGTLIIEDSVQFFGNENNTIIINGNIVIGEGVSFNAANHDNFFSGLYLNRPDLESSFIGSTFNKSGLTNFAKRMNIYNSQFINCDSVRSFRGNITISESMFNNSLIYCTNTANNNQLSTIYDCTIYNNKTGIFIERYGFFNIYDNIIIGQDSSYLISEAININNSGFAISTLIPYSSISNNILESYKCGLLAYNSNGVILNNTIQNNQFGIRLLGTCNIQIKGNSDAVTNTQTQQIKNNSSYELYATRLSIPTLVRYNVITDENSLTVCPYVYYDYNMSNNSRMYDIRYNCWGDFFYPYTHLYIVSDNFTYSPMWCPSGEIINSQSNAEYLYASATANANAGNYSMAQTSYKEVIDNYPTSDYAPSAMKELYRIEDSVGNDFFTLKNYYQTNDTIKEYENLSKLSQTMSNLCDIKLQNYSDAVNWFEERIINPPSFQDSIFAVVDLGYLYLQMEEVGAKAIGSLKQFIPKSKKKYDVHRSELLALLPAQIEDQHYAINSSAKQGILIQNHPNPFSSSTKFQYSIENEAFVTILITDHYGKIIKKLEHGKKMKGLYEVSFKNTTFASGIYFYTLIIDGAVCDTKKMVIIR
ncbi:MAG: hypothetical protein PHR53_06885 [Bacteroidales bacterium]|nr:hypothetical protein [Bacteroidales bacterium]